MTKVDGVVGVWEDTYKGVSTQVHEAPYTCKKSKAFTLPTDTEEHVQILYVNYIPVRKE